MAMGLAEILVYLKIVGLRNIIGGTAQDAKK
jgi:hypothetical protein